MPNPITLASGLYLRHQAKPAAQVILILVVSLLLATVGHFFTPRLGVGAMPVQGFKKIEREQLKWLLPTHKVLILDARPDASYSLGHIEGALPLNDASWDTELPVVLTKHHFGQIVVVYCSSKSCDAAEEIAKRLVLAGIPNDHVYVLDGGWLEWNRMSIPSDY